MAERRESVKVTADISNFTTKLATAGAAAKGFARDLDSADSRMGNLVQTGLALGPALVPIGAVAIPAITALSAGLGVAVLGAGSAVLAFQGLGDALTAANAYAIDPTATNLAALQKKLEGIGPAGRDMVVFLQDLRPELQNLKNLAGEGLFPGLQDGIDSMLNNLPQVEALISSVSSAVGDVAAGAGAGFDSPFWRDFLDFLTTNSRQTMQDFADSTGNVAQALASLWMAFDPLNDSFSAGLVKSTQAFADWSAGLSETQGFQDFTDYLRTSGPQVIDTLASLGNALVQLLEAAAPLGGPTLAVIRAIADTLAAIADSPVGPILIGTAAGLSAISRAVALYRVTSGSALVGFLSGASKEGTKAGAGFRLAGAGLGVLALSLTDLDESLGVSRTLNFAAMGSALGPWGALAGAFGGALLDAKHKNDDLNDSLQLTIDLTNKSLESPLDFAGQDAALKKLEGQAHGIEMLNEAVPGHGLQEQVDKATGAIDDFVAKQDDMKQALSDVGAAFDNQAGVRDYTGNLGKLNEIATSIQPALDSMGISLLQLRDMQAQRGGGFLDALGNVQFDTVIAGIAAYNDAADTATGRTTSVADAIAALDDPLMTAAQAADTLKTALDDLLGPELDVSAANDAWTTGLRHLTDDLAKHNRTLRGNTDAAIANREAIRARVGLLSDDLVAMARAGAGSAKLTGRMKEQRQALIAAGVAAGMSRGELRDYLDTLNLTPKMIRTLIENNASSAKQYVDAYGASLSRLDGRVVTSFIDTVHRTFGKINPFGNADGGLISGPGGPRDDLIPAWLSDGEFVVNAASAQRNIGLLHQINAQRFAGGGQAQQNRQTVAQAFKDFQPTADMTAKDLRQALHALEQTLRGVLGAGSPILDRVEKLGERMVEATSQQDRMQASIEDLTGGLQDLRQERSQIRSAVAGSINNDIFGTGLAGLDLQLRADANDNRRMDTALHRARARGLSGGLFDALAASGDLETAQQLAHSSRARIAREERLFNARAREQGDLGRFAANVAVGRDIREQTGEVRHMRNRIDRMSDRVDQLRRELPDSVQHGAHAGTKDGIQQRQHRAQTKRQGR